MILKRADQLGGDPSTQFEQAFAQLGIAYIQDSAPELMERLIGFQLVDRSDDNAKAFGVFGFDIGGQMAYAPVVFTSGEIKGNELLFLPKLDLMVPLNESWTNLLLSQNASGNLGSSAIGSPQELGIHQPNIQPVVRPPNMGKYGSAKKGSQKQANIPILPSVPEVGWLSGTSAFAPFFGAMSYGSLDDCIDRVLNKSADLDISAKLDELLREEPSFVKLAMDICDQYPAIGHYWRQFHGEDVFERALIDQIPRYQEQIKASSSAPDLLRRPNNYGGAAGLSVFDNSSIRFITEPNPGLSEKEAAQLARQGYLVEDSRPLEKLSAVATREPQRLTNPTETGIYQLLTKPGKYVRALIIVAPKGQDDQDKSAIAINLDGGGYVAAPHKKLLVKSLAESREEFRKWWDGKDSSELESGSEYVFIAKNCEGSTAIYIRSKGEDGVMEVYDAPTYGCCSSDSGRSDGLGYNNYTARGLNLLRKREGEKFRFWDGMLEVPADAKAIRLSRSEDDLLEPGTTADIELAIQEKTASLHLRVDGPEVSINRGRPITKFSALKNLMWEHGLGELDARELLKWAESAGRIGNGSTFRIVYGETATGSHARHETKSWLDKKADPWQQGAGGGNLDGSGISAPTFPDPQMGYSQYGGGMGAMEQAPMEQAQPVQGTGAMYNDPSVYDNSPENQPDPMLMQQAQQAGQTGQKELFDTSMLSSLAKGIRPQNRVQEWTRDLVRAMDRLGRILLLFYWHNEEFAERYGKNDLPDLEDALRNAFDAVGDVAFFLKEKDIEPLGGLQMGEANIDQLAG